MIITKQKILELAIKHYSLNSATEVYNMIEIEKANNLLNGITHDYFTYLPKKSIGDGGDYIQIVGIDKNGLVYILSNNISVSVNLLEIKNCIRKVKLEEVDN